MNLYILIDDSRYATHPMVTYATIATQLSLVLESIELLLLRLVDRMRSALVLEVEPPAVGNLPTLVYQIVLLQLLEIGFPYEGNSNCKKKNISPERTISIEFHICRPPSPIATINIMMCLRFPEASSRSRT